MTEDNFKKATDIQATIAEKKKAIESIITILHHRTLAAHTLVLRSDVDGVTHHTTSIDQKQIQPELDQALRKAQIRLRQEVAELEKEFEQL